LKLHVLLILHLQLYLHLLILSYQPVTLPRQQHPYPECTPIDLVHSQEQSLPIVCPTVVQSLHSRPEFHMRLGLLFEIDLE